MQKAQVVRPPCAAREECVFDARLHVVFMSALVRDSSGRKKKKKRGKSACSDLFLIYFEDNEKIRWPSHPGHSLIAHRLYTVMYIVILLI